MSTPPLFDPNYKYTPEENEEENEKENEEETRPRSYALNISPDDILKQPLDLGRKVSLEAQSQSGEGTCFAHSAARVITRLITKIIPNYFSLNQRDIEELNDPTRSEINKNCFVTTGSKDIEALRNILSPENYTAQKCPIEKKYNTLIIYYYTYLTIRRKFGCEGGRENMVLETFNEDIDSFYGLRSVVTDNDGIFKNVSGKIDPRGFLISKMVDNKCKDLINKFIDELKTKQLNLDVETNEFPINSNKNYNENWIIDIPDGVKECLRNGLYVCFSYQLANNQRYKVTVSFEPTPVSTCEYNSRGTTSGHAVVITNWEPPIDKEPAFVTIVNSWGTGWGVSGFIRIPSTTYDQFVLTPACPEYNTQNMLFSYFVVTKRNGEPYNFPTLGTKSRPAFDSETEPSSTKTKRSFFSSLFKRGGKTRRHKRKTRRHKRKTKKHTRRH